MNPWSMDPNDLVIRTMLAEDGRSPEGMAAVGHVIRNRLAAGKWGDNLSSVVLAPMQFSPWNQGSTNDPRRFDANSQMYKDAQAIWDRVNSGLAQDPTGGALHFANPAASTASWVKPAVDKGDYTKIGGHLFFRGLDVGMPGPRQSNVGLLAAPATPPADPTALHGAVFEPVPPPSSDALKSSTKDANSSFDFKGLLGSSMGLMEAGAPHQTWQPGQPAPIHRPEQFAGFRFGLLG